MCPKEKQAAAKQTFVFLGPLTNEQPAVAGSRARKRVFVSFKKKHNATYFPDSK